MLDTTLPKCDLSKAKKGDYIIRVLGGKLPMTLEIGSVENGIINAVPTEDDLSPFAQNMRINNEGWTFDQVTGMEIDEQLGWGPQTGVTGSYIIELIQ